MNFVLLDKIQQLPDKFNVHSNGRKSWTLLASPLNGEGALIHFVDYPKPWDRGARWVHPMGKIWKQYFKKTALYGHEKAGEVRKLRKLRFNKKTLKSYCKMAKDAVLFFLYNKGILKRVKGVPA